jgi:hypothetical protein
MQIQTEEGRGGKKKHNRYKWGPRERHSRLPRENRPYTMCLPRTAPYKPFAHPQVQVKIFTPEALSTIFFPLFLLLFHFGVLLLLSVLLIFSMRILSW